MSAENTQQRHNVPLADSTKWRTEERGITERTPSAKELSELGNSAPKEDAFGEVGQ